MLTPSGCWLCVGQGSALIAANALGLPGAAAGAAPAAKALEVSDISSSV